MMKKVYLQGEYAKIAAKCFPFHALRIDKNPNRPPSQVQQDGEGYFVIVDESIVDRLNRAMMPAPPPVTESTVNEGTKKKQPSKQVHA